MKHKIAFVGFGTVGQGLAEILLQKKQELKKNYGYEFELVAVTDIAYGTVYNPDGLDLSSLLNDAKTKKKFSQDLKDWDALTMIKESK